MFSNAAGNVGINTYQPNTSYNITLGGSTAVNRILYSSSIAYKSIITGGASANQLAWYRGNSLTLNYTNQTNSLLNSNAYTSASTITGTTYYIIQASSNSSNVNLLLFTLGGTAVNWTSITTSDEFSFGLEVFGHY